MTTLSTIVASVVLAALSSAAFADAIYSQHFDSMGTGTAAPAGWSAYSISGGHDTFTPADDPVNTGVLPTGPAIKGGTLQTTLIAATADTTTTQKSAQGYNWAVGGSSTNRSLGTSPTGIGGMVLQAVITNTTGAGITDIGIDYDILVQYANLNNNGYNNPPYVGKEELPGYWLFYSLDNGATYTNVSALNPDGHTWANAIGTVHESQADVALGGTWNPGASLYLQWFDDNAQAGSPDQKIGLDNLVISTVPEPATMGLLIFGGRGLLARRRHK